MSSVLALHSDDEDAWVATNEASHRGTRPALWLE